MSYLKSTLMGYDIFCGNLNSISDSKKTIISTINQYSLCVAEEDDNFKTALQGSDVLLPDGIGIVVAIKTITGQEVKKISGADMHNHLLKRLDENKGKCFYLGATENTLAQIKQRMKLEYPNIICETYSPPFKSNFSKQEDQGMIEAINNFKPNVLFVGMTAPKQEKWVNLHKNEIDVPIICSVGAVFDFYAGTIKRPSPFWINLRLEWFVRLCKEPKRMWKRYLYYGPIFAYILLKEKLRIDFNSAQPVVLAKGQK